MDEQLTHLQQFAARRLDQALTLPQAAAVLRWWLHATAGLQFSAAWPGTIGVRAYHWLRAKSGLDARGIAGVERGVDDPTIASFRKDLVLHRDWLDVEGMLQPDLWITELDVNAQYLSAAAIELGHGEPERIHAPRTLDAYDRMPGYVRIGAIESLRQLEKHLPGSWLAFVDLRRGSVLTMPTVRFMTRRGVELDACEILVWPHHRRHLGSWQALFRDARTTLAAAAAAGNPAPRIALAAVKEVTNVTVGGWMRAADKNTSDLMRKDWSDHIITEAGVRALAGIERAALLGTQPIGMRRDAVWYIGHRDFEPLGLEIDKTVWPTGRDGKLGKWKRTRCVPVTQTLSDAHRTGSPEQFVHAIIKEATGA